MQKKLLLTGLLLLCMLLGINPAYAEESKWIQIAAGIPQEIVFENEISIELENSKTGVSTVYSCTPYDDYVSKYYIEPGEYKIASATIAGGYEGELKIEYPKDTITITDNSPEVTTLPLSVVLSPESEAPEYAGTEQESDEGADEEIDMSEINKAFKDQRRTEILASLCFTLGLLCVIGGAFLIVKNRKDID